MASVSDILSAASKLSNLRADSAESDIALIALNRAFQRACLGSELTVADATYTATSSGTYLAASAIAATAVMRVTHLRMVTGGQRIPLQQVSRQELQDYYAVDPSAGVPAMYSVSFVGGNVQVDFHPGYSSGDQFSMSYLATPTTLTTATTAVPYIPEMFQHDILTNAVVAMLKERDGKVDEAQVWTARSLDGMSRLEEYLGQMGGTANRAYVALSSVSPSFPDAHRR